MVVSLMSVKLTVSRRQRGTPYTPRIEELGVSAYSIVNRTILPKGFRKTVDEDYWHLRQHVQLWDELSASDFHSREGRGTVGPADDSA